MIAIAKVIYDALSITTKIHSTGNIVEMLGLQEVTWETVKGAHGYRDRMYWSCISIHFNGSDDMGIWLEMTGQGCRAFETYGSGNYEAIFAEVQANKGDMKITRLDVAFDDEEGILDLEELCKDTRNLNFVSRFADWEVRQGNKGASCNHGSMKSELFIRIYDKAMERGFADGRHWIRVELQLRRDRAAAFIALPGGIGEKFSGVLNNYLRYVSPDGLDTNKWRWPMLDYWANLIDTSAKIQLYEKPGTDYNLENLERYCYSISGNAVDTLISIVGEDKFMEGLQKRGTRPNPKYEALKAQYGVTQNKMAADPIAPGRERE